MPSLIAMFKIRILGAHATMCPAQTGAAHFKTMLASSFPSFFAPPEIAQHVIPFSQSFSFLIRETGYLHIQATKPDTVGKNCLKMNLLAIPRLKNIYSFI